MNIIQLELVRNKNRDLNPFDISDTNGHFGKMSGHQNPDQSVRSKIVLKGNYCYA